jgi:hypothetical protein
MIDYATEVRRQLLDPWGLCVALGLTAKSKKTSGGLAIRCPSHDDSDPSCTVRIGPDGTIAVKCHACDFGGDALTLIAKVRGYDIESQDGFRECLADGADIAGDHLLVDEIRSGHRNPERQPAPVPQPAPERDYPPQAEVLEVWSVAHPCESAPAARALLESRAIDPVAATARGLLRCLPPGCALPDWAKSQNVPWSNSGYRLIARVVDHMGTVRSLRAWQVDGLEGPKRKPPCGHKAAGLVLANRAAAKMLAGKAQPKTVLVVEGEPDWATWATRADESIAVIGVGSGSWTKDFAGRIPKSSQVIVRTHCDPAGEKYASGIIDSIGERCAVWRLVVGTDGLWIDENDKAKTGTLNSDPEFGCIPINEAARAEAQMRPRVFTVRELMRAAHSRVISKETIRILTTGHWKIDMMTGGIRPGFTWVLGADTSWGKSAWALAIADENLKKEFRVLIVSTEDDEDIYGDRLLSRRSGVDATRIRDRKCDTEDHRRIAAVLEQAEAIPVYLDGRGVPFERLIHQIRALIDGEGIDLAVLDYIGETRLKKKCQDERLMFKEIAQMFRYAVKEKKRSGIILSQLTIDDPSKPPTRKNIRECRDIGSGAEGIMLGWMPPTDVKGKSYTIENGVEVEREIIKHKAGTRVMLIDKAKGGKCGSVGLDWNEVTASFDRTLRPFDEPGYEIPGFEEDMEDLHDTIDHWQP